MKKTVLLLVALCTLTGCGSSGKSEVSGNADIPKEEVPVTTAAQTQEEFPVPTEEATGAVYNSDMKFHVTGEGVEYLKDGETVQLLSADTEQLLEHDQPESLLIEDDFDFDLYADLFVPETIGADNTFGAYFRYDPESGTFTEWKELSDIGLFLQPNDAAGILTAHDKKNAAEFEDSIYDWQDGKPVLVGIDRQYLSGEDFFLDHFTVSGGSEELYMREKIITDENGEWVAAEEVPID